VAAFRDAVAPLEIHHHDSCTSRWKSKKEMEKARTTMVNRCAPHLEATRRRKFEDMKQTSVQFLVLILSFLERRMSFIPVTGSSAGTIHNH